MVPSLTLFGFIYLLSPRLYLKGASGMLAHGCDAETGGFGLACHFMVQVALRGEDGCGQWPTCAVQRLTVDCPLYVRSH